MESTVTSILGILGLVSWHMVLPRSVLVTACLGILGCCLLLGMLSVSCSVCAEKDIGVLFIPAVALDPNCWCRKEEEKVVFWSSICCNPCTIRLSFQ